MNAIFPIAWNTFREARRNRVFFSILFFAVALILFSVLFTEVTFTSHDRILRDVGFATMNLFGVAMAIFLGVGMVNREIEKKTIYTVVSKPVPRWSFILGKGAGLTLTLLAVVGLMFLGFLGTLALYGSPIESVLLQGFYGLMLEVVVLTSFAIFCSTWTSSTLSAFLSAAMFVVGHLARDIQHFGARSDSETVRTLSEWVYRALPDLERFNLKAALSYLQPVAGGELLAMGLYALAWIAVFLGAASLIFSRRDLR